MINNSSKERIKLAHELLDKELSNNSFALSSLTKESEPPKTKNVQSEISELERKLMDLEKKMENIDVSSDNDEDEHRTTFVNNKNKITRDAIDVNTNPRDMLRVLEKNKMNFNSKKKYSETSESLEEDSGDESKIYAKIQHEKERRISQPIENPNNRKISNSKVEIMVSPPQNSFNVTRNTITKPQNHPETIESEPKSLSKNPLRNSVKSFKSNKSRKSVGSNISSASKRNNNSQKKMKRSLSKNSLRSGGLSGEEMRDLQLENAKDLKKISNLEKELNHYKRLSQKQQQKLEQYRVMEIEFRKLEANFAKSEQIRKQQKKIIENLKVKNT